MPENFSIEEDFDAAYVVAMRPHFERLAESDQDVVLNFSKVGFVDSSGLGALILLHKRLISRGYKLKVVGLKGQPMQLFTNLHLAPIFLD